MSITIYAMGCFAAAGATAVVNVNSGSFETGDKPVEQYHGYNRSTFYRSQVRSLGSISGATHVKGADVRSIFSTWCTEGTHQDPQNGLLAGVVVRLSGNRTKDFFEKMEIDGYGTLTTASARRYYDSTRGETEWYWETPGGADSDYPIILKPNRTVEFS